MSQLTLNFEPALPERFPTLRAYVAHRSAVVAKPMKAVAADMDLSPSTLSRKLNRIVSYQYTREDSNFHDAGPNEKHLAIYGFTYDF